MFQLKNLDPLVESLLQDCCMKLEEYLILVNLREEVELTLENWLIQRDLVEEELTLAKVQRNQVPCSLA